MASFLHTLTVLSLVLTLNLTPIVSHAGDGISCAIAFAENYVFPAIKLRLWERQQRSLVTVVTPVSHTVLRGSPLSGLFLPWPEALVTTAPRAHLQIETAIRSPDGLYHYVIAIGQYDSGYLRVPAPIGTPAHYPYEYTNVSMLNLIDLAKRFPNWSRHFGYEYKDNRLYISSEEKITDLSAAISQSRAADLLFYHEELENRTDALDQRFVESFDFALYAKATGNGPDIQRHLRKMFHAFQAMGGDPWRFVWILDHFDLGHDAEVAAFSTAAD